MKRFNSLNKKDLLSSILDGATWVDNSYEKKIFAPEDLSGYSLNYGNANNKCFDEKAISFLKENGINEIGIIAFDKNIFSFSMRISFEKAKEFSGLIREKGGVVVPEFFEESGICIF